ncbi:MAG: type III polyketide synthase [Acidobacteria bacterium]|nr:type III polyketide synthase [Acidobacteriota bacterium]
MKVLGLGTAVPEVVEQADAARIARDILGGDERQARLVKGLYRRSGVARRHSTLLEEGSPEARQTFFAPPTEAGQCRPGTGERMQRYEQDAGPLAVRAAVAALDDSGIEAAAITHLVTISCTGFHAPGPEVALIEQLGLSPEVGRFAVGFMGCHGAFNGLRLADTIVRADPAARVLVCSIELCTLHFSHTWESDKQVANALFADGAAAFVCGSGDDGPLAIRSFGSRLIEDSRDAMSWRVGDHGFEMTLAAELPDLIGSRLAGWLEPWLAERALSASEINWAVHPGGPRILDAVQRCMELDADALAVSRSVLSDYGNMSSATIGFILRQLRDGDHQGPGVALGFGPGLMVEAFEFNLGEAASN